MKNCLHHFVVDYHTPGVDCMVYQDHQLLFRHYEGMADLENAKDMTGNELYLIFSMTKMLTCTAALQLLEKGAYSLDDPISKYLPEFERMKLAAHEFDVEESVRITTGQSAGENFFTEADLYAVNPITVRHLFTMSGGFDYDINATYIKEAVVNGKISTRELVGAMAETVLGFEPGTRFRYSLCHDVLGALIEVWSDMKLGQYMEQHIFAPLEMRNTFFSVPTDEKLLSRMAALYTFGTGGMPERMPLVCMYSLSNVYESGGAGLTSCTEDYAIFLDALACGGIGKNGNRILSAESICLMGTDNMTGRQIDDFHKLRQGYGYGFGVRVHTDSASSGSLSPHGEFGWDGAAGAFSMVDPVNNISLVYFQHVHNWNVEIQTEIKNSLYADIAKGKEVNNYETLRNQ